MAGMQVRTGTSGYAYKEWKGSFYPDDVSQKRFLEYYATRLKTVEINNSRDFLARRFPDVVIVSLRVQKTCSYY